MKSAKIFLAGMYVHLALSIAIPILLIRDTVSHRGWTPLSVGLLLLLLLEAGALLLLGWIAALLAWRAGRQELRSGWLLLKLGSIPFYVLNFLYSALVWLGLAAASRGILIVLVPIPIVYTWLLTVQSGLVGLCLLRREGVGGLHQLAQFIPVADVASTLLLLGRVGEKERE